MAARMEDRFPIVDILQQTPAIPADCQWGLLLRNHDELTLEIVTDTERDYMYRVYAHDPRARLNLGIRRRLAPLLDNDRRLIELLNGLLMSLPGTPVLYYGDEIGMGDNVYLPDRNGVRTPMQWSADRNAGFSGANPQQLYLPVIIDPEYHYHTVNVATQQRNSQSLLWTLKRLIALHRRQPAFSHGSIQFLSPDNYKVLCFLRRYEDDCILVVANLSRFVQHVELDLQAFQGLTPVELTGGSELPPISGMPYPLTLSPRAFYWFKLQSQAAEAVAPTAAGPVTVELPVLSVAGVWDSVFQGSSKASLEAILPAYVRPRRWFGAKARTIRAAEIVEALPLGETLSTKAYLTLIRVSYAEGEPDTYMLPLGFASGDRAGELRRDRPAGVVARLQTSDGEGVLFDAVWDNDFCASLLDAVARQQHVQGQQGELAASAGSVFPQLRGEEEQSPAPAVMGAEQSNTSIRFGDRLILKLFRRLEAGINPDLEIGHFLTEQAAFAHIPPVAGALEYHRGQTQGATSEGQEPVTLAILQGFVPNEGDAWRYTLDSLSRYFERVQAQSGVTEKDIALPRKSLLELAQPAQFAGGDVPELALDMIGLYVDSARLLGQRTAELHLALASDPNDAAFAPEPFTAAYQRPLHQGMRNLAGRIIQLLRSRARTLPAGVQGEAQQVLDRQDEIWSRFHSLVEHELNAGRTRIHGDYHLGQVLYTGKDFMIIDFEGEPARTLAERRSKRSPMQDVAGMLRSFHYAAYAAFFEQERLGLAPTTRRPLLEAWTRYWNLWVSAAFLKSYLDVAGKASFLPPSEEELKILLDAYLLEKAIYELGYELNNRPDWVKIPLQGILQTLAAS